MDDGSKRGLNGYILCTDCFKIDEVELLRQTLFDNFGLKYTSINDKDSKPRLRIKTDSDQDFKKKYC